jgi:hypothetical protein
MPLNNIVFGVGKAKLIDRSGATPVPYDIAVLSESSVEFGYTTKSLMGTQLFAIANARSGGKVTVKLKFASKDGPLFAALLGATTTTGTTKIDADYSVAASTSVDLSTRMTALSGTFVEDLGVRDHNGKPMKYNSGTPAVGEYKNTAAVYTFNASETGNVLISTAYTVTTGITNTLTNPQMGATPIFEFLSAQSWTDGLGNINSAGIRVYALAIGKVATTFKNEDFAAYDLEGEAMARASDGKVFADYAAQ